jgi:hypothetical protein
MIFLALAKPQSRKGIATARSSENLSELCGFARDYLAFPGELCGFARDYGAFLGER